MILITDEKALSGILDSLPPMSQLNYAKQFPTGRVDTKKFFPSNDLYVSYWYHYDRIASKMWSEESFELTLPDGTIKTITGGEVFLHTAQTTTFGQTLFVGISPATTILSDLADEMRKRETLSISDTPQEAGVPVITSVNGETVDNLIKAQDKINSIEADIKNAISNPLVMLWNNFHTPIIVGGIILLAYFLFTQYPVIKKSIKALTK
jgi:hypothetical protein